MSKEMDSSGRFRQQTRFQSAEADNWFLRNEKALAKKGLEQPDLVTATIESLLSPGAAVLDIGCADGWRLAALRASPAGESVKLSGIDPSRAAIESGRARFPQLALSEGLISSVPFPDDTFDIAIVSFVLHWVDRALLLRSLAEVDRVLKVGGHLVLSDFLPALPVKRRYHHVQDEELFTFKQDYAACFLATQNYELVARKLFNHDTGAAGDCEPGARGACDVLRKVSR